MKVLILLQGLVPIETDTESAERTEEKPVEVEEDGKDKKDIVMQ